MYNLLSYFAQNPFPQIIGKANDYLETTDLPSSSLMRGRARQEGDPEAW